MPDAANGDAVDVLPLIDVAARAVPNPPFRIVRERGDDLYLVTFACQVLAQAGCIRGYSRRFRCVVIADNKDAHGRFPQMSLVQSKWNRSLDRWSQRLRRAGLRVFTFDPGIGDSRDLFH